MKKTKVIVLTLLTGTTLAVAGCDNDKFVKTTESCVEETGNTKEWCQDMMAKAQSEHAKNAPKFSKYADCVEEFGADMCTEKKTSDGSSTFIPLMAGMLIGQMTANNAAAAPAYVNRSGKVYNPTSFSRSHVMNSRGVVTKSAPSRTSRGGFGVTGSKSYGG